MKLDSYLAITSAPRRNRRFKLSGAAVSVLVFVVSLTVCSRPVPSATEGRSLYFSNGCSSCHGASGRGDGPLAKTLNDKPTDLANPALFKRGSGNAAIAQTLAEGVLNAEPSNPQLHHTHHELVMPKFDHLTDRERHSLALYVISLQSEESHD